MSTSKELQKLGGQYASSKTDGESIGDIDDKAPSKPSKSRSNLSASLRGRLRERLSAAKSRDERHLIVEARAGTGKTFTLVEGVNRLLGKGDDSVTPSDQQQEVWDELLLSKGKASKITFCAFNKAIAKELQTRIPDGAKAATIHSLGASAVFKAFANLDVNDGRTDELISQITKRDLRELRKDYPEQMRATKQLVALCKQSLLDGTDEIELDNLAAQHDIDMNGSREKVYKLVPRVLDRAKEVQKDRRIDYDDMVWLPVVLELPIEKADLLLVDEAQDLNRMQQALALRIVGDSGRLVLCGDSKQAIYAFAGADSKSLSRMEDRLSNTERGVTRLPLTISRRCSQTVAREAAQLVPDFSAHEDNPEGSVTSLHPRAYRKEAVEGDMIVCRVNAPLVSQCLRFIKEGKRANIQGRRIGAKLIGLIDKLSLDKKKEERNEDLGDLIQELSDWHELERKKEAAKRNPNEGVLIDLEDKYLCIQALADGQKTVSDVVKKIKDIFSDENDAGVIRLSSIHKAKGLEARRVYFYQPVGGQCPHPMAKTEEAIEQEYNLRYVAITRAMEDLVHVVDPRGDEEVDYE